MAKKQDTLKQRERKAFAAYIGAARRKKLLAEVNADARAAAPVFPWRWAIEVRRTTAADTSLTTTPMPGHYHRGVATSYADEVFVERAVPFRELPARLRALADHYERVEKVDGDDAVVIVGRRATNDEPCTARRR
jgi:hypothetical protein